MPTTTPNCNLASLHYPVPVQEFEFEVSLQRTAREPGAQPETRRKQKKRKKQKNQRRKHKKKSAHRNPKNKSNKR